MYHLSGGNNRIELVTNVFVNPGSDHWEATRWKEKLIASLQKMPTKADSLKPLVQLLVSAINPSRIYLLQHTNVNDAEIDDHFDLLIITSNSIPFTEIEPILEIAYIRDNPVYCSLHNEGNVLEGLKNGHAFYSLNCIAENLIYDRKLVSYPVTSLEKIASIKSHAKEAFGKGFEKAKYFYDCAERFFKDENNELSLFMLHQAVEITCRSILQSLNGYTKKTHEIRTLKKLIRRCAPELFPIFNEDTEEEKMILNALEKSYSDARYESEFKVDENIMPRVFERVRQFQNTAFEVVEGKTKI